MALSNDQWDDERVSLDNWDKPVQLNEVIIIKQKWAAGFLEELAELVRMHEGTFSGTITKPPPGTPIEW